MNHFLALLLLVGCTDTPRITEIEPTRRGLLFTWDRARDAMAHHVYRDGLRMTPDEGLPCLADPCFWADRFDPWTAPRLEATSEGRWVTLSWTEPTHRYLYEISGLVGGVEQERSEGVVGVLATKVVASEVAVFTRKETTLERIEGATTKKTFSVSPFTPVLTAGPSDGNRLRLTLSYTQPTFAVRVERTLVHEGYDSVPTWSAWSRPVGILPLGAALGWYRQSVVYGERHVTLLDCPPHFDTDTVTCDVDAPEPGAEHHYEVQVIAPGAHTSTSAITSYDHPECGP